MANYYDIAEHWEDLSPSKKVIVINSASDEELRKWAIDPDCNQKHLCVAALAKEDILALLLAYQPSHPMNEHVDVPFNPRTEVSEDARHIARTGMQRLGVELEAVSIWELTHFAWKWWWAVLIASIPIAGIALLIALIIAGLNRP